MLKNHFKNIITRRSTSTPKGEQLPIEHGCTHAVSDDPILVAEVSLSLSPV